MSVVRSRLIKVCLFIVGILSLVLGVIGVFLPMLPTTPFVLLSAWCFLRSSKFAHSWMYRQPFFGDVLRDWEENQSISVATKLFAVAAIFLSILLIWIKVEREAIQYPITAMLLLIAIFIVTRKTSSNIE